MRDCLIMGSGRSGTSMLAGTLAQAGYFMGDALYVATDANPKGFFEDREVSMINEELLAAVVPRPRRVLRWTLFPNRLRDGQRWVAALPAGTVLPAPSSALRARMEYVTARRPLCLKDPRFAYTLPHWLGVVPDAARVVVFREPGRTAQSIVKECREGPHMSGVSMTLERALHVWTAAYEQILRHREAGGDWLFLHYDSILDGSGLDALSAFLDAPVDRDFAEERLRRSADTDSVGQGAQALYARLCELDPTAVPA